MKKIILLALLILIVAAATVRPYNGLNMGVAWDWGGIEIKGTPGLFLCSGNWNPSTNHYTAYFWADWFPNLIVDC